MPFRERVSGSRCFPLFYERYRSDPSVTIFLCGTLGNIAERAMHKINANFRRRMVVGAYGPPPDYERNPAEIARIRHMINESGASVLLAGLGVPKREWFIFTYREKLPRERLFLPLGGTIDYEAGDVALPPEWITDAGLEWLARVVREPRRRWRRYLVQQPPVLSQLLRQASGTYRDPLARNLQQW
jgi:exopolysaccharide biosynthesis WecB/TagA/CpsF family protein